MTFWDQIRSIWIKKKKEENLFNQIEVEEKKIVLMQNLLTLGFLDKLWIKDWLIDKMFENYKSFSASKDSMSGTEYLIRAQHCKEIIDEIESVTEDKIMIAEENLKLLKGK